MTWATLLSPAGASPTGVDQVFVPSNGVITLNLNQIPAEKTRLKGFSTNRFQTSHGKGRFSCLKKAVSRDSCLVFRENLGIRAGLRRAPRPDGPLTHFASLRGEKCRLVFPPPPSGSYKRETSGSVSTPLAPEDFTSVPPPPRYADHSSKRHPDRRHGCLMRTIFGFAFHPPACGSCGEAGRRPEGTRALPGVCSARVWILQEEPFGLVSTLLA